MSDVVSNPGPREREGAEGLCSPAGCIRYGSRRTDSALG